HNAQIDVFDKDFHLTQLAGSFTDPNLPKGYAPFNIQNLGGKLYVTYAKQDEAKHDDVAGPGLGFVDVYDMDGHLTRRLASHGPHTARGVRPFPPADFGPFSNDLLVGNFGNGRISAFNPDTGKFLGQLSDKNHRPIKIDGLWGLTFGNGVTAGDKNVL